MEEQPDWGEAGVGIMPDGVEQIAFRGFQDEGGDFAVIGGQVRSERGSYADAIGDNLMRWNAARGVEVSPGRFGVLDHPNLIGVGVGAVAVAAVVEGKDIDAEIVEPVERRVEV